MLFSRSGMSTSMAISIAVFAASVLGLVAVYMRKKKKFFVEVGKVSKLIIYPLKSAKGIEVDAADALLLGLKYREINDRHWLVVDAKLNAITARQHPTMLLVTPSLHGNELYLDAPDMDTLRLPTRIDTHDPDHVKTASIFQTAVKGMDCGDKAANWISTFLDKPGCRIMHFLPDFEPRKMKDFGPYVRKGLTFPDETATVYGDVSPYLLVSEATVEYVNSTLKDVEVSIANFRPNIIVSGVEPYDEAKWGKAMIGNTVESRYLLKCGRCTLPNIDPRSGIRNKLDQPRKHLKLNHCAKGEEVKIYGDDGLLGIYVAMDQCGAIRVGDPVSVTYR